MRLQVREHPDDDVQTLSTQFGWCTVVTYFTHLSAALLVVYMVVTYIAGAHVDSDTIKDMAVYPRYVRQISGVVIAHKLLQQLPGSHLHHLKFENDVQAAHRPHKSSCCMVVAGP